MKAAAPRHVGHVRHRAADRWQATTQLHLESRRRGQQPDRIGMARRVEQRGRRCFLDGYSDRVVCASPRTIGVRDFVLLAAPAVVAIACLAWEALRQARQARSTRELAPGPAGADPEVVPADSSTDR